MSPTLTHLRASDFNRTPWKNGLGHTDQIAIHPPSADLRRGDFAWRVSTARITQSAPFSIFPEHDRVLVILEGRGVRLSHTFVEGEEPEIVDLPPLEPYEFPGDVPTRCELQGGPIQDFSVFLRKGEVSVNAEAAELPAGEPLEWEPQANTSFVYVARGGIATGCFTLKAGEALRVDLKDEPMEAPLSLEPTASGTQVVLVQVEHAG